MSAIQITDASNCRPKDQIDIDGADTFQSRRVAGLWCHSMAQRFQGSTIGVNDREDLLPMFENPVRSEACSAAAMLMCSTPPCFE